MAGFNKLFVMLPVMLAARQLNMEDPVIIYWLRIAYFSIQTLILVLVAYVYYVSSSKGASKRMIYVPSPPQPFGPPDAKKKYTETTWGEHVVSQARSLLGSTLFGIAMTSGLHFYRGMVTGLAIQSIMGPFNLVDNALIKAIFLKGGLREEDLIFEEKTAAQLTPDDEVVDGTGNPVVRTIGGATTTTTSSSKNNTTAASNGNQKSFEELLLDTWDAGAKANLGPLMEQLNKKNCNLKTKDNGWTPLMILSGLTGVKGCASAIRQVIALGGNPAITDVEGWNAMHWAAYHGSADAAKVLIDEGKLFDVKDKEGKKPLDYAIAEANEEVVTVLKSINTTTEVKDEGLRKRK